MYNNSTTFSMRSVDAFVPIGVRISGLALVCAARLAPLSSESIEFVAKAVHQHDELVGVFFSRGAFSEAAPVVVLKRIWQLVSTVVHRASFPASGAIPSWRGSMSR